MGCHGVLGAVDDYGAPARTRLQGGRGPVGTCASQEQHSIEHASHRSTALPNESRLSCGRKTRGRPMRPLLLRYPPGAQTQQFLNHRARQLQALVMRRSALGAEPVTDVLAAAMRLGRGGLGVAAASDGPGDRHSTCGAFPPSTERMLADRRMTNRA
jgi:hypothetical protein